VNIKETEKTGVTEQVYLFAVVLLLLLLFRQKKKNGITNGVAKGRGRAIFKDRAGKWAAFIIIHNPHKSYKNNFFFLFLGLERESPPGENGSLAFILSFSFFFFGADGFSTLQHLPHPSGRHAGRHNAKADG
jgi:hypothetical protein